MGTLCVRCAVLQVAFDLLSTQLSADADAIDDLPRVTLCEVNGQVSRRFPVLTRGRAARGRAGRSAK